MDGRDFLPVAAGLASGTNEAGWRTAAGLAYYALFLEARMSLAGWGFVPAPRDNAHTYVRLRFSMPASADLKPIGRALEKLGEWRNKADYDLGPVPEFASAAASQQAVARATAAIALLDQLDADPARSAAAIAAIRAAFAP